MNTADFYAILQIDPSATTDEVRAAYKRLAFLYHPDRSDHPLATEYMQRLNEAYGVLNNPEKRTWYDQERLAAEAATVVVKAQPAPVRRARPTRPKNGEERKKQSEWMRGQLKIVFRLFILMGFLFFWSLATGQVNLIALFVLVLASVYVIFSVARKIRYN